MTTLLMLNSSFTPKEIKNGKIKFKCKFVPVWYQVSIPSQRRYVGYWESLLSIPRGAGHGPPKVNLPPPCSRELRRIRLYDTVNIDTVFFVISELQEVSSPQFMKCL